MKFGPKPPVPLGGGGPAPVGSPISIGSKTGKNPLLIDTTNPLGSLAMVTGPGDPGVMPGGGPAGGGEPLVEGHGPVEPANGPGGGVGPVEAQTKGAFAVSGKSES